MRIFCLRQKYEFLLEHLAHNVVEMKGDNRCCTLCETVCRFEAAKCTLSGRSDEHRQFFNKPKIVCVVSSGKARRFALCGHRSAARRKEGCVLSSAKIKVFFRITMISSKENGVKKEMDEMCEKSCGLSFDSPLLWRKNALLF